jgi:hypothetical protein
VQIAPPVGWPQVYILRYRSRATELQKLTMCSTGVPVHAKSMLPQAPTPTKAFASNAEPKSYHNTMHRPDSELWYQAMVRKMEAHLENGTWELVKLTPGRKAIGYKWVSKVKCNPEGTIKCYKARLVAKGFGRHPGIDFNEMFAPTTK